VGDHDDRDPALGTQPRDQGQDHRALLGAHRGQRLVEQDDVGVRGDGAGDRVRLALAAGQARAGHVDARQFDADLVVRLARVARHRAAGQERERLVDLLAAQEHVRRHGQLVDEREVLVDAVDPERARVVDRLELGLLATQQDPPLVRLLEARDDLDQGRLAGAVVAEQPQHLALAEVQVDVAQRRDRAEALGDVLDLEDVLRQRRSPS
jgi:hypothetical protein